LHYTGYASSFDDVHVTGSLKDLTFVTYYFRKNKVVAASAMQSPNAIMIINEAMRLNLMPDA